MRLPIIACLAAATLVTALATPAEARKRGRGFGSGPARTVETPRAPRPGMALVVLPGGTRPAARPAQEPAGEAAPSRPSVSTAAVPAAASASASLVKGEPMEWCRGGVKVGSGAGFCQIN